VRIERRASQAMYDAVRSAYASETDMPQVHELRDKLNVLFRSYRSGAVMVVMLNWLVRIGDELDRSNVSQDKPGDGLSALMLLGVDVDEAMREQDDGGTEE